MATSNLSSRFNEHKANPNDYYQMDLQPKGLIYIINNHFCAQGKLERHGSEIDVANLEKLFKKIACCEVVKKPDLSADEICSELLTLANSRRPAAFYAIFIMSHGEPDEEASLDMVVGHDRTRVSAKELIHMLDVPHLHNIPVLMFFQICRGDRVDGLDKYEWVKEVDQIESVKSENKISESSEIEDTDDDDSEGSQSDSSVDSEESDERDEFEDKLLNSLMDAFPEGNFIGDDDECADEFEHYVDEVDGMPFVDDGNNYAYSRTPRVNPTHHSEDVATGTSISSDPASDKKTQNMLVSFSAVHGYPSVRNILKGGWFIQAVCRAFRKYAKEEDVIALMNRVHVAISMKRTKIFPNCKFAARTSHTLRKQLFFFPGLPNTGS